jgi:hypothetical protein
MVNNTKVHLENHDAMYDILRLNSKYWKVQYNRRFPVLKQIQNAKLLNALHLYAYQEKSIFPISYIEVHTFP